MTGQPGNGQFDPADDEGLDDDTPLDAAEEAAAAAEALAEADESLDERVEGVVEELDEVVRRRDGESVTYLARGAAFAVLASDALEVALDAPVAKAALKTPGALRIAARAWLDHVQADGRRPVRARPRGGVAPIRTPAGVGRLTLPDPGA